jgi:flagellar biosynthesis protein FlhB
MRARVLWEGFGTLAKNRSLAYRLWRCNSFDIVMQFILVHIAAVTAYTQPFFLQRILSALETVLSSSDDTNGFGFKNENETELRAVYASAYVDALLFFVFWIATVGLFLFVALSTGTPCSLDSFIVIFCLH